MKNTQSFPQGYPYHTAETWQAESFDVSRAALESFARAASGGTAFPITTAEMIHGAAVTEAIVKSAQTGLPEKVS